MASVTCGGDMPDTPHTMVLPLPDPGSHFSMAFGVRGPSLSKRS